MQSKTYWSYLVYESGVVCNKRGKQLKPSPDINTGYLRVYLYDDYHVRHCIYLHRLVAFLFVPNPNNLPEVNHKNKDVSNCASLNLEWCTRQENMEHGKGKSVQQCDKNGNVLNTFITLASAARYMNRPLQTGNLHKVCIGMRKTWLGYYWRYTNEKNI